MASPLCVNYSTTCFGHRGGHHQVVHSLREKLSTICNNKPKNIKTNKKQTNKKTNTQKNQKQKQKTENYDVEIIDLDIIVFCFLFLFLVFLEGGCFLVFWFVVAYCTQLLSQAMYNLMMATTMAGTCSC